MIKLGYMAKRIVGRPDWLDVPSVHDVYAVSNCISPDFADYIDFWSHNGFWFFDKPSHITRLCSQHGISLDDLAFVYYEAHSQQFDTDDRTWHGFVPDPDIKTDVSPPTKPHLLGYDIVCYSMQNAPECSPLSCNQVAADVRVNSHCLIDTLDYAIECLETGIFDNAEPGPMRVIAVHTLGSKAGGEPSDATESR
ncbi:hypothetical protein SH528x_003406 [Novipirellula sp. SH528]|uniref:hypothetical protein n=1 Tax=Novipirellula sp. SH528 TaxID=3454466 RepID=UPI003F9F392C